MPSPGSVRALRIAGWLLVVFAVGLMIFDADLLTWRHVNTGVELSQLLVAAGMVGVGGSLVTLQPAVGGLRHRVRQQPRTYKLAITIACASFVAALSVGAVAVSRLH